MTPALISPIATTRTNYRYLVPICLVATLGGLLFGYDTGVISGAIEPLTAKFGLSDFMKGWASGCVLIGCATGVLLVGPISDRFGRKLAMRLAALMFLASAIGTSLPQVIWVFVLFRIIGGLGIGIASISTPMYIAEITPAGLRGRMVALNQIAIVGGIAATAFINFAIAHAKGDPALPAAQAWLTGTGWRWMFATAILPAALFALLLLPIPESPRWLFEQRRDGQAQAILTRVAGPVFAEAESAGIKAALAREQGTWSELFSPAFRLPLFLGISLAVLQQVTGINVFLYFGATIFKNLSASTGVDAGLLQRLMRDLHRHRHRDRRSLGTQAIDAHRRHRHGSQPPVHGRFSPTHGQSQLRQPGNALGHPDLHRLFRPLRGPRHLGHSRGNLPHCHSWPGSGLCDFFPLAG